MIEPNSLTSVAEFHSTFKHPILDEPQIPAMERCRLRIELLAEELKELQEGIENKNIVEIADAFCDLQYVLSGAILEFGLSDKFKELFDEVHRSNMSKACKSIEEAEQTVEFYKKQNDCESYYKQEGALFLVYRKTDNKVLKSINYSPANLQGIL
ncbi:MAG: nucleoside triphosphate pyrophosphohydrolase family protein [Niabella sp.]